jgi:hypothetical protein
MRQYDRPSFVSRYIGYAGPIHVYPEEHPFLQILA